MERLPSRTVLLAGRGMSTNIVFNALETQQALSGVLIEEPVPRWQFLLRRARRLGFGQVAGQVLFQALVPPLLRRMSRSRMQEIALDHALDLSPIPESRVTRVGSANSAHTRAMLQSLDPDVVVVNGTRILDTSTLSAVPARFINIHAGITPMYRGVHGGYWALASSDSANCGVTVHEVDAGVDTGPVLGQARVTVTACDNFTTYPLLQLGAGLPLLLGYLAARETPVAVHASAPSRLWSHPTLWAYLRNLARAGIR